MVFGLSPVELKVSKNGIFWAENLFQKKFPRLFCKLVYIVGGALKAPPPATRDAFQMLPQVGLILTARLTLQSNFQYQFLLISDGMNRLGLR